MAKGQRLFSVLIVSGSVGIVILGMAYVLWDIKQMNSYMAAAGKRDPWHEGGSYRCRIDVVKGKPCSIQPVLEIV